MTEMDNIAEVKPRLVRWALALTCGLLWAAPVLAQLHGGGAAHGSWPDSLDLRTLTGRILVESSAPHEVYYLDEDGDGEADFRLAFGPWWYEPDTGAERPDDGSTITVRGSTVGTDGLPTLVVFEIDGVPWREPVEYGMRGWNGIDFWSSTDTITVAGTVIVDTTYFYHHFYLDTDNDSLPEYQLVFGPEWYQPASGAKRPDPGAFVTVFGAVHATHGVAKLVVYDLNGERWRELGEPAGWAGSWMRRDHADTTLAYCVNDSASWIAFPPGHVPDGMGGMHWPDSMFVQFWRIHPDSLPGGGHPGHFVGFFIDVNDPNGSTMMGRAFGGRSGMMSFARDHRLRLHYHDDDLPGASEDGIQIVGWDQDMQEWMDLPDATADAETNTVSLAASDLFSYYALINPDIATGVGDFAPEVPVAEIALRSSYPNPFRGVTTIIYELSRSRHVVLSVYDLLGRKVATLVDEVRPAGLNRVSFDANAYPSGVYLYRIEGGGMESTGRMALLD